MEIIRAKHMGFCFGVSGAIETCYNVLKEPENLGKKIYILGMLVHNEYVVKKLEKEGFNEVYVQPTHFIAGHEYEKLKKQADEFKNKFDVLKVGVPLLSAQPLHAPFPLESLARILDSFLILL